jgi:hypothetical protein
VLLIVAGAYFCIPGSLAGDPFQRAGGEAIAIITHGGEEAKSSCDATRTRDHQIFRKNRQWG